MSHDLMSDDNYSDVSLDEEDEELIWRVFYAPHEEKKEVVESEPEDFTDLLDVEDRELVAKYHSLRRKLKAVPPDDEKRRLLMASFSNEEMERFEAYRRMTVNKNGVKKVCHSVLGHSIAQNITVVMAGLGKTILGDIITRAFDIQQREQKAQLILDIDAKKKRKKELLESDQDLEAALEPALVDPAEVKLPLQPEHIREAWRLYKLENSGAYSLQWRAEGEGDGKMFR